MNLRVRIETGIIDRPVGYVPVGHGIQIFNDVLNVETRTNHVALYLKNKRKVIPYKDFDRIVIEKEDE